MKRATWILLGLITVPCQAQLQGNLYLVQSHDQTGYINQEFPDQMSVSTIIGNVVTFDQAVALDNVQQRGFDFGGWFVFLGVPQAHLTISRFAIAPSVQHMAGAVSTGADIVFEGVRSSVVEQRRGALLQLRSRCERHRSDPGTYLVTSVPVASISTHGQGMTQAAEGPSVSDSSIRGGLTGGQWVKLAELAGRARTARLAWGLMGRQYQSLPRSEPQVDCWPLRRRSSKTG